MSADKNRLTVAALAVFAIVLIFGSLGWCGSPKDHQPKPKPSVSEPAKKNPIPSVSRSK